MNAIANQAMPALGVQIASMVGYANALDAADASMGKIVTAWGQAHDDVIGPFNIGAGDPPQSRAQVYESFEAIVPQVCEKFDERVNRLYQVPVTKPVLDEQRIDVDMVKRAREFKLISELPANTLIQSALTFGAGKAVQAASPSVPLLMANVGVSILYGVIMTYILFSEDLPMPGINSAVLPIIWSLVLIYSIGRANNVRKVKDAFAKRWREIFPNKES